MKAVMPGGSGHVGSALGDALRTHGAEVVVLSRNPTRDEVFWDGRSLGPWAKALDGADVVINLAGRSVSCRYNETNRRAILE